MFSRQARVLSDARSTDLQTVLSVTEAFLRTNADLFEAIDPNDYYDIYLYLLRGMRIQAMVVQSALEEVKRGNVGGLVVQLPKDIVIADVKINYESGTSEWSSPNGEPHSARHEGDKSSLDDLPF